MKVLVIYKPISEHATEVEQYMRDFFHRTGRHIETMDPETREGSGFCETYDIVAYPTLIALDDHGTMQNMWSGALPTISEVSYYAQDN
ncbi:hypothetical protein B7Z28_00040 [Candidatus Saccharibacteria bacterium 32-45-3]|nr:MAG: hypothetical protein B7Z28_00040 [Candidatus Saccharibacteria bacterium 32-45-3]